MTTLLRGTARLEIRAAQPADIELIATLHSASWRGAYRGILTDDFLDNHALDNRIAEWQRRIGNGVPVNWQVLIAFVDGRPAGFTCAVLDKDERFGALVDNLHLDPAFKGMGIGSELLHRDAAWIHRERPQSGLHLWVWEKNVQARGFYERLGGSAAAERMRRGPDGTENREIMYHWPEYHKLLLWTSDAG